MGRDKSTSRDVVISNKLGIHARPASLFVQTALRFDAAISVHKDQQVIDGKCILAMLALGAAHGTRLRVSASGKDAIEALNTLESLINNRFGEE